MAAKNSDVAVAEGAAWVRLTDAAATVASATIQVKSGELRLMGTTGAAPTSGTDDGLVMYQGNILLNRLLSDLFPGVAATQLWGRAIGRDAEVFVSHAA